MEWLIIVVIAYLPILYKIHKRINYLENEVKRRRFIIVQITHVLAIPHPIYLLKIIYHDIPWCAKLYSCVEKKDG